ncbi:MAG: insulinase family protein [Burkholderiales bacterium]|nr:insulinase family protein [Bacteroidia bacterium]
MQKTVLILLTLFFSNMTAQVVPSYETFSLKNGLKVYLLQYGNIPAINVRLVLNTGKVNEAPGQQNYSDLVSNSILMGNTKYDIETQTNKAFVLGTSLAASSTNDNTVVEMNILSKDLDSGMDLMSAAVLTPTFPKDKIDQLISRNVDFNSPTKMDISELSSVFSNYFMYGISNPMGRYFYKTQLQKITPALVKEYYDFNYTPKNANLIICGSFDMAAIKPVIEKYYGSWKSAMGNTNGVSLESIAIKKKEIGFINRNGATQCAMQWNKIAPAVTDKDQLAFSIANGIFNEVLFKEIREKGGKTYSIGSTQKSGKFSNTFIVGCSVRNEELFNTIELFDKTLSGFYASPISETTFKESIYKRIVAVKKMESPEEVSSFYNPLVYNFEKRKNIIADLNTLNVEDVNKVIKKYFTPDAYKLVVAGDESKVTVQITKIPGLKKFMPSDIEKDN